MSINKEGKFILLCCLVYFTSYITRINYGATLVEMVDFMNIKSSTASIAVTCSFISYGLGQLIAGFLGDKMNPKSMVSLGLIISSSVNILVALTNNIYFIIVIWTINGFAQALLWPPLVKLMTNKLPMEYYKRGCALVTISASVATVFIYMFVPMCISLYNFKLVFILSALLGFITFTIWSLKVKNTPNKPEEIIETQIKNNLPISKIIVSTGLIPIMFAIVLQGLLRDGITTWMPTFINDTFKLPSTSSILTTTILPIFSIICVALTRYINKKISNDILLSSYIWIIALVSCIILVTNLNSIVLSIVSMSFLTACMHGINLLLIGNLPAKFVKYGKVSTISGILNSCTYIGSALSAYGIAVINDNFGWTITIILWIAIIVLGGLSCAVSIKKYKQLEK